MLLVERSAEYFILLFIALYKQPKIVEVEQVTNTSKNKNISEITKIYLIRKCDRQHKIKHFSCIKLKT